MIDELKIDYFSSYKKDIIIYEIYDFLKTLLLILIKIKKFQILHLHTASYWSFRKTSLIITIGKLLKKKVIVQIHGGGFPDYYYKSSIIEKRIIKKIFKETDRIIVLSNFWKYKLDFCDRKKIIVIQNTIYINKNDKDINKKVSNGFFNILFLGDIIKRKGIFDLLIQ